MEAEDDLFEGEGEETVGEDPPQGGRQEVGGEQETVAEAASAQEPPPQDVDAATRAPDIVPPHDPDPPAVPAPAQSSSTSTSLSSAGAKRKINQTEQGDSFGKAIKDVILMTSPFQSPPASGTPSPPDVPQRQRLLRRMRMRTRVPCAPFAWRPGPTLASTASPRSGAGTSSATPASTAGCAGAEVDAPTATRSPPGETSGRTTYQSETFVRASFYGKCLYAS